MSAELKNLVLITRPVADAEDLARDINDLGFGVLIEPMMGIVPTNYEIPDLVASAGLIFTSANAVRVFGCPAAHRDLPVFAVGQHTAQEARQLGYTKIFSADGDANDLAALIKKKADLQGQTLWHIRGEHVTAPLEEILKKDKIQVEPLIVYTAKTEDNFTPKCLSALKRGDVKTVTFFSKRTAENFIRIAEKERILANLSGIKALCISPAVLDCVRNASWEEAYSAERPDRAAMLDLLRTVCVQTN